MQIIHAIAWIKWAAAQVNGELLLLPMEKVDAIQKAALKVALGHYPEQFPVSVWQTGSGTQSHMNVNEVIAKLASTDALLINAHDDVNLGQSTNDVFPSAIHIAVLLEVKSKLLPSVSTLRMALRAKQHEFSKVVKVGRTHLQDATPITLGQEFGGYDGQIESFELVMQRALENLQHLAIGGTAVGTGFNTHPEFGGRVALKLRLQLSIDLCQAKDLFAAMGGTESLIELHAALKQLALTLLKIGNDIRLMASGPRAGFGEINLPENEPGSSMMPGKVNPTQIEAMNMVAVQVFGHDSALAMAASQGQLEINVFQPLFALNILDSINLLADAIHGFTKYCLTGIEVNAAHIEKVLQNSLMLVTALSPYLGYDKTAQIAQYAHKHNTTLREAGQALAFLSPDDFDRWVDAHQMISGKT